jgi:hypothetical protein
MPCSSLSRNRNTAISRVALVCAALCSPAATAEPPGPAIEDPDAATILHSAAPAPVAGDPGPGSLTLAHEARDLQQEVSAWLHEDLGLPVVDEAPEIVFVPDDQIADHRVRDVPADRTGTDDADVLAVYDDDARTIYLPESWSADRSVGGSILVHETVHHIQNLTGETFACPEAREMAAFDAQERWLNRFGDSLESEFGIDPFTVIALGMCGW